MKFTDKQHMRQGGRHAGQRQQKTERRAKERGAGGRHGKGGGRRAGAKAAGGGASVFLPANCGQPYPKEGVRALFP